MNRLLPSILLALIFLSACAAPTQMPLPDKDTATASPEIQPTQLPTVAATTEAPTAVPASPTATLPYAPDSWMDMPVYPETISQRVIEIYQTGQALGNNAHAFSRMGDCDSLPFSFLGDFDKGSDAYNLGEYSNLAEVVEYFQGSWGHAGVTAHDGFNTASMLSPLWADPKVCETNETPLECEVRTNKPAFMLIALGSNDFGQPDRFETNMRQILDYLIENGIVPILGTKADNLEGDHRINSLIGQLAYEYQLPVWNFWRAVQPLDNHGVRDDDNYHPTHPGFGGMPNDFSNPVNMQYGFPWRNLTALQTLDAVMRGVTSQAE